MIERLTLTNWRAYDQVTVEFTHGTTFIVAPNSVGKTSLVLGLGWALFGAHTKLDTASCVRAGAERAEAQVDLTLDGDRTMSIRRSCGLKGRPTATYTIDGSEATADVADAALERAFGVELDIAAQLSMMLGASDGDEALDLRDHLYRVFGVSELLSAAVHAQRVLAASRKTRGTLNEKTKARLADRAALETQVTELDNQLSEHDQQLTGAQERFTAATAARDLAKDWSHYDHLLAQRSKALDALVEAISDPKQTDPAEKDITSHLEQTAKTADAAVVEASAEQARATGHTMAARHALSLLNTEEATATCPTCLRPFAPGESTDATASHEHTLASNQAAELEVSERLALLQGQQKRVDELLMQLAAVPSAPSEPTGPRPTDDVDTHHQSALEAVETTQSTIGGLRAQRQTLSEQLAADDKAGRESAELESAFRHEALAEAATRSLKAAAEEITRSRIDPLADQVRWRWKRLFGGDGLQLRPDGSIVRIVGDRELPWETLSGGERIWARLVTHLLVVAVSTQLPFVWFDEPLEHLDPRARRAVAASLTAASAAGGPRQIIVTTYEHTIAQQLAAESDTTTLQYVRATELP